MGKTKNTKERSQQLQEVAMSIINQPYHDSLPLDATKALRTVWQKLLIQQTGCTPFTARSHIAKALRRMRYKNKANES